MGSDQGDDSSIWRPNFRIDKARLAIECITSDTRRLANYSRVELADYIAGKEIGIEDERWMTYQCP